MWAVRTLSPNALKGESVRRTTASLTRRNRNVSMETVVEDEVA